MKKATRFIIITLIVMFFAEINTHAMELIVGAKAWYVTWIPWLRDSGQTVEDRYFGFQNVETGDGFMYGPSASLRITNDISFSISYLYGILDASYEHQDRGIVNGDDMQFSQTGIAEITRQDLDTALSYSLKSWLKIFIGYKYQPLKMVSKQVGAERNYTSGYQNYNTTKMTVEQQNHCPAFGFGFALPFAEIFAFNTNISALYLKGHIDLEMERVYY